MQGIVPYSPTTRQYDPKKDVYTSQALWLAQVTAMMEGFERAQQGSAALDGRVATMEGTSSQQGAELATLAAKAHAICFVID